MTIGAIFIISIVLGLLANSADVYDRTHSVFDPHGARNVREFLTYSINLIMFIIAFAVGLFYIISNWNVEI